MHAKLVDASRLAGARHTADAHTHRLAAVGQTLVDDLLCLGLMVGVDALHQRDGLREDGHIAFDDAFHHVGRRQFATAETVALQVGVDDGWLLHAAVHLQTCIFGAVFWMFHSVGLLHVDIDDDLRMFRVVGNHEHTGLGAHFAQFVAHGGNLQFGRFAGLQFPLA